MQLSLHDALIKAQAHADKGESAEAEQLYRAILAKLPDDKLAQAGLAALASAGSTGAAPTLEQQLESIIGLYNQGQLQQVIDTGEQLLVDHADAVVIYNILGAAHAGLGRPDAAIKSYRQALEIMPDYVDAHNNLGVALMDRGELAEAIGCFERALAVKSDYVEAHNNLGNALKKSGDLTGAVDSYRRALAIAPNYVDAHNNLGVSLEAKGHVAAAADSFREAVRLAPNFAAAHNNLGNALATMDDLDGAAASYHRALEIAPNYAQAHYNLGKTQRELGQLGAAIESYSKSIQLRPDYAEAHNNLGNAFKDRGALTASIASYSKALELNPELADAHNNLGTALMERGEHEAALKSYHRALELNPGYAEAYNNLAVALNDSGDNAGALANYRHALAIKTDYAECYRNYSLATKIDPTDPLLPQMRNLISQDLVAADKMQLSFAMAKAELDLENHAAGVEFLNIGSALRKSELGYSIERDRQLFMDIKSRFGDEMPVPDFSADPLKTTPIFVLGMPRSGTTLVEQIISSHDKVHGAGELEFLNRTVEKLHQPNRAGELIDFAAIRQSYIADLAEVTTAEWATDKMPLNFRWIGHILQALPESKIVHVQREAAAVCWSNFRTYFPSKGMAFSFDQQDVAAYYRLYDDLMTFWQQRYPGRIHLLNYEQLTEDQEAETRKLLGFLGLEWQDKVLDFHKNTRAVRTASNLQVRRRMYTGSSKEWEKFRAWLSPMLDELGVLSEQ